MSEWQRDREWEAALPAAGWNGERPTAWRKGELQALVSRDEIAPGDMRWHISLAHRDRVPNWNELAGTAHALRPGVPFAIGVPPRSWWINVHKNILHLYELKDANLIAQWRLERQGHTPS